MWFWLSTDWYKKTNILAVPYQPDHGNWCIKDHYILMKVGGCKILLCMRQMIDKLVRILEKYTVNHLTCWQNLYRICSISSCFYHTVSLLNQTPQMAREPKYLEINEKNWMKKVKNIFSFHFYQSSWNQKVDKYQDLFLYIHRTQNWQTHCYLMKDRICWKVGSSHHAS